MLALHLNERQTVPTQWDSYFRELRIFVSLPDLMSSMVAKILRSKLRAFIAKCRAFNNLLDEEIRIATLDPNYKINDAILQIHKEASRISQERLSRYRKIAISDIDPDLRSIFEVVVDFKDKADALYLLIFDNTFSWSEEDMTNEGWS